MADKKVAYKKKKKMEIILNFGKQKYLISFHQNDTIKLVKKIASMKCFKNEKDLQLYFHGMELKNLNKTLEEYGLKDKDVIVIHVKHEMKCSTKAR